MSRSVWIHHDQSQYLRRCLRDYAPGWRWAFEEVVCASGDTYMAETFETLIRRFT